ncbi:septal ring lytic transglycosylase RlpA family protein [Allopusillimonas ginsengisoli]|uniref:septal ring lytic transglycosylase RlpA family protein n=1 Tax=Allopusillimonas ginsengisoli TaxID=453575 RepID=UPI0010204A4C|nr:septal ring lytic transglycosylase RlpA family protein [Allopusillimonas ginsengisoli]TEA78327.1 septal ring lytic transglycosylase RlpA family protein [Allopusillimonas ginsengisoli]
MNRFSTYTTFALILTASVLAGCAGTGDKPTSRSTQGEGYYKDDGPGSNIPSDIENIPNAVPRIETHTPANFRPYTAFGKQYIPVKDNDAFRQEGTASWYGRKFHGKKTANGEIYDMYAMTAAHPTLPLPSYARVTRASTGKSVIVRVNDRGPFHSSRIIDLSYVAASKLGLIGPGSGKVIVEAITNDQIREGLPGPGIDTDLPRPEPHLMARDTPDVAPEPKLTMHTVSSDGSATTPQPVPDALEALALSSATNAGPPPAPGDSPAPAAQTRAQGDTPGPSAPSAQAPYPTGGAGQVFLQFGAFSASSTANALAHKLNAQIMGVETRVARVQPSGDLYRVRIGPYASRTEAVNAALRIEQETGMNSTMALR